MDSLAEGDVGRAGSDPPRAGLLEGDRCRCFGEYITYARYASYDQLTVTSA